MTRELVKQIAAYRAAQEPHSGREQVAAIYLAEAHELAAQRPALRDPERVRRLMAWWEARP